MSEKRKWMLFYVKVSHIAANVYPEIKYKHFDDELDLLVWASEMHIPKQIGMHWILYRDEITRLPVDLYERIDHLTKKRVEAEAAKEPVEVVESKPHKRGRPKKEAVCTQSQ